MLTVRAIVEPMADPEIRNARDADASTVVGWFGDRAQTLSWAGKSVPDPLTVDWLSGQFKSPGLIHRVAVDASANVVGLYGLHLSLQERRAHVMRVAVAPPERRRGLGAVLLQDAVTTATALGFPRLTLFVYGSNEAALALYLRLGWCEIETTRAPEDPSGFKRLMVLEIDA